MWLLLHEGIPVIKHNRKGHPKPKTLFCDLALTKLYWREPGSLPDEISDDDLEEENDEHLISSSSHSTSVNNHHNHNNYHHNHPNSHNHHNHHHSTFKSSSFGMFESIKKHHRSKQDAHRCFYFKDILQITNDYQTDIMQRSITKHYFTSIETQIISIIISNRTLDLEINAMLWNNIFYGLQILIIYYQTLKLESIHDLSLKKSIDNVDDNVVDEDKDNQQHMIHYYFQSTN